MIMKLIEIKNLYTTRLIEIEYLENSGTQYIDTEVLMNSYKAFRGTTVEFEVLATTNGSTNIAGAVAQNYHNYNLIVYQDNFYIDGGFDFSQYTVLNTKTTATITKNSGDVPSTNFILFGRSNNFLPKLPVQYYLGRVRIYSCKIIKNEEVIRDFIPVRIGTKGYMLDKNSGELYGNSGTGDFILGQDIGYVYSNKSLYQIY